MTKVKIAIQGELGAYSHIAANNLFKDSEIKTCATFEETFKKAYEDDSYKIIIPIENSFKTFFASSYFLEKNSNSALLIKYILFFISNFSDNF